MSSDLGFSGAFEAFSSGLEEFDVEDDMSGKVQVNSMSRSGASTRTTV